MNSLTPYSIKNKISKGGILITLVCLLCACYRQQKPVEAISTLRSVHQGVAGKILFKEGEFTISGDLLENGKVYGIERQLLFYERTSLKDVEIGEGNFVKNTYTELLDSVYSDKQGNFGKELPEGNYSVFVKESRRLYSKLTDDGYFMPLTVFKDSCKKMIIEVDYKASYLTGR
jgi:hypothetical protein